jgi:hypothetical protein
MSRLGEIAACPRMIVSTRDARHLAQRLLARGISSMATGSRIEKTDLTLAGRLLLLLLEDYSGQESLEVDGG